MTAKLAPLGSTRTRQPPAAVGIDWNNSLTRGLANCLLPRAGLRDRVSGEQWVNVGVASAVSPGLHGIARDTRGGDGSLKIEPARNAAVAAQTHLLVASKSSQSIDGAGFFAVGSLADEQSFSLISYANLFNVKSADGQAASTLSSVDPVTARPFVIAGDGSGSALYYGGNKYLSSAITPTARSTSRIVIFGDRYADGTYVIGGQVFLYAFWSRRLREQEIASLSRNPWQLFAPEQIPFFTPIVTAQYARPVSDAAAGAWTASSGSDLYAMLDETAASDADYIVTTGASTCEVALGALTDPAVSTGHIVRYRISATGGGIIVRLRQGTTTIASWVHAPAPTSPTTYEQTLSGGEADSITDYAALKLQFEATT